MSIAVVVPTFNRKEVTLRFLERVCLQSADISIYVCDSGSTDGTVQAIKSIPKVNLIQVGNHAWWSAAVNRGVDRALIDGHEAVLIMNDDIEFDLDLIARLVEKHQLFPSAIISPLQESPSGLFLGMCYVGWSKEMKLLGGAEEDVIVDTTNGCCLLVPRVVFTVVGKIDEARCPHQYGDTEFQLRAKNAGFPTLACPDVKLKQLGATDYYTRISLGSMLNFAGSPLHFPAYVRFGTTLFKGYVPFLFYGVRYHYRYIKTVFKALLHLAKKMLRKH